MNSDVPLPTHWYRIGPQDTPFFRKPSESTTTIIKGGQAELIGSPRRAVLLPLVDLSDYSYESILEQMLILSDRASTGLFYGVVRPTSGSFGLCYSCADLIPMFQDENNNRVVIYEIPALECRRLGLPQWREEPEYAGLRPTRFERTWVI